jgi:hypothetical protein
MTFLPIAEREMRVAILKRATYWSRVVAGSRTAPESKAPAASASPAEFTPRKGPFSA